MQHLIREHGPASILATAMILTGSLIGKNSTDDAIMVSDYWCKQISPSHQRFPPDNKTEVARRHAIPDALNQFSLATSLLTPMIPVLVNFKTAWFKIDARELAGLDLRTLGDRLWSPPEADDATNKWTKLSLLKMHVLGQTTVYAVNEVLRHYITSPSRAFWDKCNITKKECLKRAKLRTAHLALPGAPALNSSGANYTSDQLFCPNATVRDVGELYDELHYFPNLYCMMLGASSMSIAFYVALYFCKMESKEYFGLFSSCGRSLVVLAVAIYLTLFFIYAFYLYKTSQMIQLVSFFGGLFIQMFVLHVIVEAEGPAPTPRVSGAEEREPLGWNPELELKPIKNRD